MNVTDIDFLKIDIEGGEFEIAPSILKSLAEKSTTIYLSLHVPFLDNSVKNDKLNYLIESISKFKYIYDSHLNKITCQTLTEDKYTKDFENIILSNQEL